MDSSTCPLAESIRKQDIQTTNKTGKRIFIATSRKLYMAFKGSNPLPADHTPEPTNTQVGFPSHHALSHLNILSAPEPPTPSRILLLEATSYGERALFLQDITPPIDSNVTSPMPPSKITIHTIVLQMISEYQIDKLTQSIYNPRILGIQLYQDLLLHN
jgi:hypothetical protein